MGRRYILVEENESSGLGCALFAIGLILLVFALPVFILWYLLFVDFKRHYNYLKYSLSKFTRSVLVLWAGVGFCSYVYYIFLSVAGTNTLEERETLHFLSQYGVEVYSGLALILIAANAYYNYTQGLDPWSGEAKENLRSKSITRAIGWSVLIFLLSWVILGLLGLSSAYWLETIIIALVSYFVIENFL